MKRLYNPAFTMIELMIVVAIIAFLGALALPNYFKYLARAKQTEVVLNLSSLHAALYSYWSEHGSYTANLKEAGWQPAGASSKNFNYTYGFNIAGAHEGEHYFVGKLNTPIDKLNPGQANKSSFKVYAAADLLGKGKLDVWEIDENRNLVHTINGID